MQNKSQSLLIGLSFLVVGIAVGLAFSSNGGLFKASVAQNPDTASSDPLDQLNLQYVSVSEDDDAVHGDANAPVTIVEFSDFECPYCARFAFDSLPQIVQNYVDTGKVKIVYRDFPLPIHPESALAAEAAECVGEKGGDELYFQMHDKIFNTVADWSYHPDASDVLIGYASDLGVDIKSCLENHDMAQEVTDDFVAGKSYGVSGTPTFFINGWMLVGAYPYDIFQALIERELNS